MTKTLGGVALALVLAVPVAHATTTRPRPKWQSAICAAFEPWSAPWIFFGCYVDQPPKDPTT